MSSQTEELSMDLLEQVLSRLELADRAAPTLDGLDCRLQFLQVSRETFRERHEQTRAWSPFNYELYARSIQGETVVGVACGQRVAFDSAGGVSRTPLGGDDRLRVLVDELGMHEEIIQRLPLDTPTPPPP
jgi:hypothetical protein